MPKSSLKFSGGGRRALFSGVARAKLNFHQPFLWVLERGGRMNSNSDSVRWHCLFTPQNFFNKHIRLTGQGSLLKRVGAWQQAAHFAAAFLYLSKTTWLCRLIPSHPFARYFPFASIHFLPLSVVLFSIYSFYLPLCALVFTEAWKFVCKSFRFSARAIFMDILSIF